MSIFVNPTQFGPSEDYRAYPRTLDGRPSALIAAAGNVDLLFVPDEPRSIRSASEHAVRVQLPALSRELCGASRPGHFDGVATVVCRLLNIVAPDVLFSGQKDYQQFVLVQRMIEDLRLPVELRMAPTLREPDGLAMSSRNRYLDAASAAKRRRLHRRSSRVRDAVRDGARDFARLDSRRASASSSARGFGPTTSRFGARGPRSSRPRGTTEQRIVLGAARLGRARLIDNLLV